MIVALTLTGRRGAPVFQNSFTSEDGGHAVLSVEDG
jgi:hypothetical protein